MRKVIILFILIFAPCGVFAITPAEAAARQGEIQRKLWQDSQDLLRQRELEQMQRAREKETVYEAEAPAEAPASADESCINIRRAVISGFTKFKEDKIREIMKPNLKKCITKTMLSSIQSDIQQAYVDRGYVGARVYYDFKDIKEGVLQLIISEGIVESVELVNGNTSEEETGFGAGLRKLTAFPFMSGRVLNLRDIEQGLDQINKLSSSDAAMDIRPGKEDGGSVVVVTNKYSPANTVSIGYDNSGQKSTGGNLGRISYSKDNLLSLNENIYLNYTNTMWQDESKRYSKSFTGSISIPFGYWTLSDDFAYSKYLTTVTGAVSDFESSGNSTTNTLTLDRMLSRGAKYKLNTGLSLRLKSNDNYLEDVHIDSSSKNLSIATLYLSGTYYSALGSFLAKLSVNRGLDMFGAKADKDLLKGEPRAQFTSFNVFVNYSAQLGIFSNTLSLDAQYSLDDLFASEQIMIGGESSVRGFKESSLSAEHGFYLREEIKAPVVHFSGESENPFITRLLSKTNIGIFADGGYVKAKTFGTSGGLAGAGAKISFNDKYFYGNFSYSRALYADKKVSKEGNIFYFSTGINVMF
ncbi:Hemolysin activation/secretion protein [Parelusimicrobium proximum]|uniref:ShlB/FhaC/HecB family hemolysin secretion/activation protein n=1 Tax=Parelusimicrobium proximum TaxID=3228953 RepID=UPI003D185D78